MCSLLCPICVSASSCQVTTQDLGVSLIGEDSINGFIKCVHFVSTTLDNQGREMVVTLFTFLFTGLLVNLVIAFLWMRGCRGTFVISRFDLECNFGTSATSQHVKVPARRHILYKDRQEEYLLMNTCRWFVDNTRVNLLKLS